MSPVTAIAVGEADERTERAKGGMIVFDSKELEAYSRELRLRYLADAIRGDVYTVEGDDIADSMLRIVGQL